ncbi:hypothetical protein OE903_00445 [Bacillus sp. B6(2022)]|nr:hypothetical protein [Bacillus sp. B6(2022)]
MAGYRSNSFWVIGYKIQKESHNRRGSIICYGGSEHSAVRLDRSFLFLVILLIFMKVTISLDYSHANDNDHIAVKIITLYGIVRLKKDIPMVKVNTEDQTIDIREKKMASTKTPNQEKETMHKKWENVM